MPQLKLIELQQIGKEIRCGNDLKRYENVTFFD